MNTDPGTSYTVSPDEAKRLIRIIKKVAADPQHVTKGLQFGSVSGYDRTLAWVPHGSPPPKSSKEMEKAHKSQAPIYGPLCTGFTMIGPTGKFRKDKETGEYVVPEGDDGKGWDTMEAVCEFRVGKINFDACDDKLAIEFDKVVNGLTRKTYIACVATEVLKRALCMGAGPDGKGFPIEWVAVGDDEQESLKYIGIKETFAVLEYGDGGLFGSGGGECRNSKWEAIRNISSNLIRKAEKKSPLSLEEKVRLVAEELKEKSELPQSCPVQESNIRVQSKSLTPYDHPNIKVKAAWAWPGAAHPDAEPHPYPAVQAILDERKMHHWPRCVLDLSGKPLGDRERERISKDSLVLVTQKFGTFKNSDKSIQNPTIKQDFYYDAIRVVLARSVSMGQSAAAGTSYDDDEEDEDGALMDAAAEAEAQVEAEAQAETMIPIGVDAETRDEAQDGDEGGAEAKIEAKGDAKADKRGKKRKSDAAHDGGKKRATGD